MSFDLGRYQGLWYEIAKYPFYFEQDCQNATAEYTLKDNGLEVVNTCYVNKSPVRQDIGFAEPSDTDYILLLTFTEEVSLPSGKSQHIETPTSQYQVLWTDYDNWSFVGSNVGNYWVLSRKATYNKKDLKFIYDMTLKLGFVPDKVIVNPT